jgi:uncharacterized damage-inducible protein DinB
MHIEDVRLLYDYNVWANQRILEMAERLNDEQFLAEGSPGYAGMRSILLHILDSEYGWRVVCQHQMITPDMDAAAFPSVGTLVERWREEQQAMRTYLASLNDTTLAGVIRYTNSEGTLRERVLWHCLVHVINHSTQHRSEAAIRLTEAGYSPGDLDFTTFLNERH